MKVISTNIGQEAIVDWNGRKIKTGIFKNPVDTPIFLDYFGVKDDTVSDVKVHGGKDKACYSYSENSYSYWKEEYPEINFTFGFFGENLTISDLDESKIHIGDVFKIGKAKIQVTQPRQPCFKLGIKFGNKKFVKGFVDSNLSGIYFRILESGFVAKNDKMLLLKSNENSFTVIEIFKMLYDNNIKKDLLLQACKDKSLAISCKKDLMKKLNNAN